MPKRWYTMDDRYLIDEFQSSQTQWSEGPIEISDEDLKAWNEAWKTINRIEQSIDNQRLGLE